MKQENETKLNERVARLEVGLIGVCNDIERIRNNELPHINIKIDKLDERFDILDKKVDGMAIKVGFIAALLTVVGQAVLNYFLK